MTQAEPPTPDHIARVCAQVLPDAIEHVERMTEGGSTWVYRVVCEDRVLYARVLPEDDASFAPEAFAHTVLRAQGVRVPDVVYWDDHPPSLRRSLMLTTAVAGQPLDLEADKPFVRDVLHAAGRDLARANLVPVDGWGWATRTPGIQHLAAPYGSARAWMESERDNHLAAIQAQEILTPPVLQEVHRAFERYETLFAHDVPCLAHGDFDLSHIFIADRTYSGIIDWGEIRGAPPFYDLGHFYMHHTALLPLLTQGYEQITSLPFDIDQRIGLVMLHIAIERVGGGLIRRPHRPPFAPYVAAIEHALALLP